MNIKELVSLLRRTSRLFHPHCHQAADCIERLCEDNEQLRKELAAKQVLIDGLVKNKKESG